MSHRASSVAAPAGDTRQLILQAAQALIQTRSYLGLSFQELADRVGIRKASLYHHFESKEALGVAVIESTLRLFDEWASHHQGPAPERLLAYIRMFRNRVGAGERVCPGGAMVAGWDCIDSQLQQAVQGMVRHHLDWLGQAITELPPTMAAPGLSAQQQATHLHATCQGALLMARLTGQVCVFDDAVAPLVARLTPP